MSPYRFQIEDPVKSGASLSFAGCHTVIAYSSYYPPRYQFGLCLLQGAKHAIQAVAVCAIRLMIRSLRYGHVMVLDTLVIYFDLQEGWLIWVNVPMKNLLLIITEV